MGERAKIKNDFGAKGWSMIFFCMLMYYNFAAWTADGINIFSQAYAKEFGWDPSLLLSFSTPANWVGVIGALIFAQVVVKKGSRFVSALGLIIQGIISIWFGNIHSVIAYAIAISALNFFVSGFGYVVPGTIMNVWFPRKKGLALGWATMGMGFCTASFVALLSYSFSHLGISKTMTIVGCVLIVLGIASIFWVKDTPEIAGAYPDNEPNSKEDLEKMAKLMNAYKSPFTLKVLLKDKDMWLISLGYGCVWLVTIGIVSQYVVRLVSVGYSESFALTMLSSAAFFCLIGSYLWGWLDQKAGTKKASMIYIVSYIITLVLLLVEGNVVLTFITSIAVGSGLAGIKNFITSMTGSVYGRYDFAAANRLVTPIANSVRALPFVILGVSMKYSGGFDIAYMIFIVIDLVGLVLISRITSECKGTISLEISEQDGLQTAAK
ncbi:MFS transporter [Bacillus sp. USDA818B3_A]|uniref:MFS transporter n=1 Tax=Bacillus sp. USDA818B3_A TaxID=2698834 RepID=UPI00136847C9|nr:MFS transporter [Bacillus sp. USDA818B3_A]